MFRNSLSRLVAAAGCALALGAQAQTQALRAPIGPDFFGMHVRFTEQAAPGRKAVSAWPYIPIGSLRIWNTYVAWYDVEPKRGQYDFKRLDRLVDRAAAKDTSLVLTLGRTPTWASSRPEEACGQTRGCAAEPRDPADWDDYVRALASRYKGRIDTYEIWNEPGFADVERVFKPDGGARQYYTGSAASMVELARRASQVIRAVDPRAKILTPSVTSEANGIRRLETYLKAGGGKYADVVGYHFYVAYPEDIVPELQKLRAMLSRNGVGNLPLWDTETGFVLDYDSTAGADEIKPRTVWSEPLPPRVAGMFLARSLVLQAGFGVERVYWFNWDHDLPEGPMGLSRGGGPLNAAGDAWVKVHDWLLGAQMRGCARADSGLWRCQLVRDGKPQTIAWRERGSEDVPVGAHATAEPLFGTAREVRSDKLAIGQEPVLLVDVR